MKKIKTEKVLQYFVGLGFSILLTRMDPVQQKTIIEKVLCKKLKDKKKKNLIGLDYFPGGHA